MSRIEELINRLCPDGVEFKKLGEICKSTCSGGTPNSSNVSYYNGNIPWLRTQEVDWCNITDTSLKITEEGLKNSSAKWIPVNCVIVAMYGATAGKVAINKIPLTTNQACCNLEIDGKIAYYRYVYHYLAKNYLLIKSQGRGSQSNINSNIIKNLNIPIPPLEIQQEIVRILDNFTELTNELTNELTARKKQYEYYRDKLLTFDKDDDKVKWMKLGEVAEINRGVRVVKRELSNSEGYPVFQNSLIPMGFYKDYNCSANTTFVISAGSAGEIGYNNYNFWAADDCLVINTDKEKLCNKFIYYFLLTQKYSILSKVRKASVPRISRSVIENMIIPIPSIEIQQQIINILDRFDQLYNDLTAGLATEIEARRKQYEYYRDKLLTFKEKKA